MAITVGTVSYPRLEGLRLQQIYVNTITDAQTITTGIPNIKQLAVRTGSGSASGASATSANPGAWNGSLASARRVAAHLTTQATGVVTFNCAGAASNCILMIWSGP